MVPDRAESKMLAVAHCSARVRVRGVPVPDEHGNTSHATGWFPLACLGGDSGY